MMIVGAFAATTTTTTAVHVIVDQSALHTEVRPLLEKELHGHIVEQRQTPEDLTLQIDEHDGALWLVLVDVRNVRVLERRLALDQGRTPALRSLVVAVEQAVTLEPIRTNVSEPPTPPPAPLPRESPPPSPRVEPPTSVVAPPTVTTTGAAFGARVGAGLASTWAGQRPQLGLRVHGEVSWDAWRGGIAGTIGGVLCCRIAVNNGSVTALDGTVQSLGIDVFVSRTLVSSAWVDLAALVGVGAERLRLRVVPQIFSGTPATTETVRVAGVARIAAVLSGPLLADRVGWRLDLGAFARSSAPKLALPPGFPTIAADLEVGPFGPYAALSLEAKLF